MKIMFTVDNDKNGLLPYLKR